MITFLTLFLGLATGPQRVALAVTPPVARVELRLDGAEVAELTHPPWGATIDLGGELAPHRLEAIAYDRHAHEVARVEQTINHHARRAQAELALERDAAGHAVAARLVWQSVEYPQPARVDLRLDGEPLEVADPRRFPLPPLDPDRVHVLSAELVFPDASTARADVGLGGAAAGSLSADNTALAVAVDDPSLLAGLGAAGPAAGSAAGSAAGHGAVEPAGRSGMTGLVRTPGGAVRVLAVERGAADLVVVPDRGAESEIAALRPDLERLADRDRRHVAAGLEAGDRLFLVSSLPERARAGGRGLLFRAAPGRPPNRGGLAWQLAHVDFPDDRRPQRLADAAAVAGMIAAAGERPRAVLLVLGPDPEDASRYPPAEVRRFLARLRVPLAIWQIERDLAVLPPTARPEAARRRTAGEPRRAALHQAWGAVEPIGSAEALYDAARRLRGALRGQRLLWVEGAHLPTELTLDPARTGVRLAVGPPAGATVAPEPEAAAPIAVASLAEETPQAAVSAPESGPERQPAATGPPQPAPEQNPAAAASPEPAPEENPAGAAPPQPPADAPAGPARQEAEPAAEFAERVEVSVLELEVVVTDRRGRRIHGLGREDFEVRVGGRPAEVAYFDEVGADDAGAVAAGGIAGEVPAGEVAASAPAAPRAPPLHLVVYADQISLDPVSRARAVRALRPFLETRLAAGAQVMVASWNGSLQLQAAFTGDPSAIAGALDALGSAAGGRLGDAYDFEPEQRRALEALGTTVAALAGLDGRKALLYVGGGIPFVPAGDLYRLAIRWSDDPRELVSEYFASDASARFAELARHANAAGVTLYTLDAAGVRDPRSVGPETDHLRAETENDAVRDRLMIEPLELLAEETGGVAMVDTNALGRALAEAAADFDDHYALGLRPPRGLEAGADVPIEVRVRRPDATARHRRSFRPRAPSG